MIIRKTNRQERADSKRRLAHALDLLAAGGAPVPPDEDIFVGDGSFTTIAAEFLRYFVEFGGLKPGDSVLDIGSGIGRMATGLSLYLDEADGRYIGFDPVREGVAWCKDAFAERKNFRFVWSDIYNELYNPAGTLRASDFEFPCDDASIDLAIATSVFTHLYEEDIFTYLRQTARVLRTEGRLLATAYLFVGDRPVSRAPHIAFEWPAEGNAHRWHIDRTTPLSGVCFDEDYFRRMATAAFGREPLIRAGRWRGGPGPWFQDLVLA